MNTVRMPAPADAPIFANRVQLMGTEAAFGFGSRILEVEQAAQERVIRCNLGQPDFPLPNHIAEAVIDAVRAGHTTYCDPQGMPELRAALAGKMAADRGLPEIDPERVVVFPGARPSIGFAQQSYCEQGDEVIYPTPGYPLYESYIPYVGAKPIPIHLQEDHGFSLTTEELEPLISDHTKLIYLNFPSNPTGGVASKAQLEALAELILEKTPPNVRVYSDEAYEAIVFDSEDHFSIASVPGMEQRTIIASAVSKTYSWTGGRVGWAVYPTVEEAKVHRNLNINYFASIPPYNQIATRVALESPESGPAIQQMTAAFQRRRDQVISGLNRIDGIQCQKPKGAFYAFPNIAGVVDRLEIQRAFDALPGETRRNSSPATLFQLFLLYRYHVATMDRRSFGALDSEGQHFLRLSVATGASDLEEAVRRIAAAAGDAEGFHTFMRSGVRMVL
ncbi:MAG: aminotransferase class I/II-fold pyridoxal phosphate-dependent enzyme [Xanthomonadales bacterium]|nr:aminotransferase class I/II-fold pyridoxal phosphate-dependent enzyme [Gammaproteobacteria bacterium]MBT8053395.1 aminotransferase class I/II-fold pyridoxal phosphate-dependent enzyme [Gammaproteobacteria bacterium]NND56997.1 aminotransferase class I/II-fold pyridoxal phosphate-dependent enzyme [Xanthomonadales bacterium]NNK50816.1 aminotransferase class I/II-fold pyridoxal phosphate-dependent enzyme [Xanthomonadales bacterium]